MNACHGKQASISPLRGSGGCARVQALPEHGLRRALPQVAATAAGGRLAQPEQRRPLQEVLARAPRHQSAVKRDSSSRTPGRPIVAAKASKPGTSIAADVPFSRRRASASPTVWLATSNVVTG